MNQIESCLRWTNSFQESYPGTLIYKNRTWWCISWIVDYVLNALCWPVLFPQIPGMLLDAPLTEKRSVKHCVAVSGVWLGFPIWKLIKSNLLILIINEMDVFFLNGSCFTRTTLTDRYQDWVFERKPNIGRLLSICWSDSQDWSSKCYSEL